MSDAYTITDLEIMHELTWLTRARLGVGLESTLRESLLGKGYAAADIDRHALPFEYTRYVLRYREHFAPPGETELTPREHLIQVCGYPAAKVDTFLAEQAIKDADAARRRAEREAYERTWRYRAGLAYRETRARLSTAWAVLRGRHECDGDL